MSAFGGTSSFNSQPYDRTVVAVLARALTSRGPDSINTAELTSSAMVFCPFYTTRRSRLGVQPCSYKGAILVAFDGRLDNYKEIVASCRTEPEDLPSGRYSNSNRSHSRTGACADRGSIQSIVSTENELFSDSGCIAAHYETVGGRFCEGLYGDYAVAVWDERCRTLFLARDPFGMRPLYYYIDATKIIWSSEIEPLIAITSRSEIDEEFVAGYLTLTERWGRTPYRSISSVPPGHLVTISEGKTIVTRYWEPNPNSSILYKSDAEYEEHFRTIFERSVALRLDCEGPVLAELSGGLDSSSIVCVADNLIRRGAVCCRGVETVSFAYDGSPDSDERKFITLIEEYRGKNTTYIRDDSILDCSSKSGTYAIPNPQQLFSETMSGEMAVLEKTGARVLLSGHGGDHVTMNDGSIFPLVADSVVSGRILEAIRTVRSFGKTIDDTYAEILWSSAIWPLLPLKMKAWRPLKDRVIPSWINREFSKRTQAQLRKIARLESTSYTLPSKQYRHRLLVNAISLIQSGYHRERGCVDVACPFLDRDLVTFLISIPPSQLFRPSETRSLHRRAMNGLLPEKIRKRRSKKGPDAPLYNAMWREWGRLRELFSDALLFQYGFVDRDLFGETMSKARFGMASDFPPLLRAISLELWLRQKTAREKTWASALL
jgi:asparagine synthase (glutamine-hydrolysing)